MYKLNGHSLQKGAWFEPESQSMTLIERNSSSSITLGPDAPEIGFNDWLLDDEWPEGPTVWRVKSIDNQTDTETVTIGLEHVIRMLEDPKLFEDVEAGTIGGGETCTSRQAIEYLLARQSDWVLGDCVGGVSLPYEFNGGDSLLDAIESVSDTIEDAEWWYDLEQYPFVLHIRKRNSTVMSEMRGGRNVSTLRRSINRSGMYTRIWPVGKNDLHISGDYISRNENIYGRIDKVETNEGKTSEDSLRAWGDGLLRKHCEPTVTITIGGLELSQETGESLDWIQLNRVCRCPLPEFNTTILERVIKITWRDRRKDPEAVTVTLGNSTADVRDLTKTVEETSKRGGSGARGQAKQNYLFEANGEHLLYEVFDECGHLHGILRMTETSLRVAFENLNECTRSEFYMTSESLRVQFENELASTRSEFQMTSESLRVTFENEIASTRSQLEMTSESLRAQFENEISSTRSEFQQTSESLRITFENELASTRSEFRITSESLRVTFENELASTRSELEITSESLRNTITNTAEGLQSQIDQTAEAISLKVSKGDVATQLSVECGNVSVTGGNLTVDGMVTANSVQSAIAQIAALSVIGLNASGTIKSTTGVEAPDFNLTGGGALSNAVQQIFDGVADGGRVTFTYSHFAGQNGTFSFNIADTQYYQDGVAAVTIRSASWNSRDIQATLSNGRTILPAANLRVASGYPGYSANNAATLALISGEKKKGTVDVTLAFTDPSTNSAVCGTTMPVYVNAGAAYSEGYGDGTGTVFLDPATNQTLSYGQTVTVRAKYLDESGTAQEAASITVTAPANREPVDAAVDSKKQGQTWYVNVDRMDGESQLLEVNMASVYADAQNGWTQGVFTLASVTKEGQGVSIQEIGSAVYFKSESITPVGSKYSAVTNTVTVQGEGVSVQAIGTPVYFKSESITPIGTGYAVTTRTRYLRKTTGITALTGYTNYNSGSSITLYKRSTNSYGDVTYSSAGYYVWRYGGSTQTLYESNGSATDYDVGSGGAGKTLYEAGSAVTRYEKVSAGGSGISTYYNAKTAQDYYKAGSSRTFYTHNNNSSADLYAAGTTVTRYEKVDAGGSGISTYYNAKTAQDYYRKGETVTDTYYTKA